MTLTNVFTLFSNRNKSSDTINLYVAIKAATQSTQPVVNSKLQCEADCKDGTLCSEDASRTQRKRLYRKKLFFH